jgi:hypothetical protein
MDTLNNLSVNKMANSLNAGNNIQQTVAVKMLKDSMTQEKDLVKQIVNNSPKFVEPKSFDSTFEAVA